MRAVTEKTLENLFIKLENLCDECEDLFEECEKTITACGGLLKGITDEGEERDGWISVNQLAALGEKFRQARADDKELRPISQDTYQKRIFETLIKFQFIDEDYLFSNYIEMIPNTSDIRYISIPLAICVMGRVIPTALPYVLTKIY